MTNDNGLQPITREHVSGLPEVRKIEDDVRTLVEMANQLEITTDTAGQASDMLGWLSQQLKEVEARRKAITQPINDSLKQINGMFAEISQPLKTADAGLRKRYTNYLQEQERLAIEAEAERRAQEEKWLEAEADDETGEAEVPEPEAAEERAELPARPQRVQRTPLATTYTRTVPKWEIEDKAKVPADYWKIDEAKIGKVVRAGVREIPGVRIWEEKSVSVRGKG